MIKNKEMLCIDVDIDKNKPLTLSDTFNVLRALYEYSFIEREVRRTKHGLHIYIHIPYPDDRWVANYLRFRYGDDRRRMEWDLKREIVNICFNSKEIHTFSNLNSVVNLLYVNPELWC